MSFPRAWARRTLFRFRARLAKHQLVPRVQVLAELRDDPAIAEAVRRHAVQHGQPPAAVRSQVDRYLEEIVPAFNVLSYYRLAYTVARRVIRMFYRPVVHADHPDPLGTIPREDGVVYLANHRSNADYVLVMYLLAREVSISYAVGEWARTWPLEYLFKTFGSYFVRRRFPEPLYHTVLERYVQLITRRRVTQGIFPEGGLSRTGRLLPPKIGLLDSIVRTLDDPDFGGDIWLIPVGINYDRVLEDRTLINELLAERRPAAWRQLLTVLGFLGLNFLRLLAGQQRRYGVAAVAFGRPVSVRAWLREEAADVLRRPRAERRAAVERLANGVMERIGRLVPATPVPLAALALLSFEQSVVREEALLDRLAETRARMVGAGGVVLRPDLPVEEVWARAWKMFRGRRLVLRHGAEYVILPSARPLLEYYANSVLHLAPREDTFPTSPGQEGDATLPRLPGARPTSS